MIDIETISNSNLEREYISSLILKKISIPQNYSKLRLLISEIPILDTSEVMNLDYPTKLTDKLGLLIDNIIENYYYGKKNDLLEQFVILHSQVHSLIPVYRNLAVSKMDEVSTELDNSDLGYQFETIAFNLGTQLNKNVEIQNYDKMNNDLQKMSASLLNIISMYGSSTEKVKSKSKFTGYNTEYRLYVHDISINPDNYVYDPTIAVTLGKAVSAISEMDPTYSLDPFAKELEDNLLMVLQNPKDFYIDCKADNIVSSKIGTLFALTYPEFHDKFLDIYLEDYDKMSYPDQINFRKCFGLVEDTTQLTTLCSANMNIITQASPAAQGV